MTVFVDTSALVAVLDADDHRHADAKSTFEALLATASLLTHNYVEVEADAVVRRRLGAQAAAALVERILPVLDMAWIDPLLHREARATHRADTRRASLVDHVSFALMRRLGIDQAFAYDSDFIEQGFLRPDVVSSRDSPHRLSDDQATYDPAVESSADLVSVAEIARRARSTVNTVQSWRRRHADFPVPVARLGVGPVWTWPPVDAWIAAHRRARGVG